MYLIGCHMYFFVSSHWIIGEGEAKTDYCISPDDIVPTPRPTRKPTPRPTMPTGSNKLTRVGNNLGEGMLGRCEGEKKEQVIVSHRKFLCTSFSTNLVHFFLIITHTGDCDNDRVRRE